MSRTQEFVNKIRKTPLFKQLIPMEAGVGWPIPLRKEGKLYLKLLFFGQIKNSREAGISLYPPFATVTVNWANSDVVEFIDFRFQKPTPEWNCKEKAGVFPHPTVEKMGIEAYKQKRQELYSMYDSLLEALATGGARTPEQDRQFGQLLSALIEPSLVPYYRSIAPKFIDTFLAQ